MRLLDDKIRWQFKYLISQMLRTNQRMRWTKERKHPEAYVFHGVIEEGYSDYLRLAEIFFFPS